MVSYIDSNLMDSEKIVHRGKIHWIIYVTPVLMLVSGILLMLFAFIILGGNESVSGFLFILGIVMFLISIGSLLNAWIKRFSTELAVTNKRIIAKFGFIERDTIELNLSQAESFTVSQSISGRILNYGTLVIKGTGGVGTPIPTVAQPLEFRRYAMQEIDTPTPATE